MPDSAASREPSASDPPATPPSEAAELEIGALEATLPPRRGGAGSEEPGGPPATVPTPAPGAEP
jgi:hypothetical protein